MPPAAPAASGGPDRCDLDVRKRKALFRAWLAFDVALALALVGLWLGGPWFWAGLGLAGIGAGYGIYNTWRWQKALLAMRQGG